MLLGGIGNTQFDALRLRLFALDVFFFGTAIVAHLDVVAGTRDVPT